MKLAFKKIPKLAIAFYLVGFVVIGISLYRYFYVFECNSIVLTQQLFIGGAIIVAFGSVINTLSQFRK